MRVAACAVVMLVASCSTRTTTSQSAAPAAPGAHPVSEPEAKALAARLETAASSCEASSIAALFDRKELLQLVERRAPAGHGTLRQLDQLFPMAADQLCAWVAGAIDLRVLRIRSMKGEPRLLLRKITDFGVGYFDVRIRVRAEGARILDVYSHNNGTWISQEIADIALSPGSDDPQVALTIKRINSLDQAGKHAEAQATLDSLPEPVRNMRVVQSLRVAIAGRTSLEAYQQALTERARQFPDDKITPFTAMNLAAIRRDFTEALRQIDVLDAAVGGDPFLDAIRAPVLVQRNGPGDLEAAAARAERAVKALPELAMTHYLKLTIALARSQWSTALATLDVLERDFGMTLTEDARSELPNAEGLFASPEYAAWRKRHP